MEPEGASRVAAGGHDVVGYVAIWRGSAFAGFRDCGIPLVRQVAVACPFRRQGIAALLRTRPSSWPASGASPLGITVGLFAAVVRCPWDGGNAPRERRGGTVHAVLAGAPGQDGTRHPGHARELRSHQYAYPK